MDVGRFLRENLHKPRKLYDFLIEASERYKQVAVKQRLNIFAIPNPDDFQPYNINNSMKELIDKIQNPDLKIIAYILLYQNEKLDDISKDIAEIKEDIAGIKDLMESEVWNRELHLVGSSKVKPKNIKVILKPDLESRRKYADAVYIYEDKGELVARIVEAKSSPKIDPEVLREKFKNTEEYVKEAGYDVNRFEWILSVPEVVNVPSLEGIKVIKNPEVMDEDE